MENIMRKRWPIFTSLQLWELWSMMSTDFPHDSFRIYTAFLLFEILELVWESGTHFPWHIWSYMRRKDPFAISCSTEYWQKAIKSSAEWILPSSPPPTLHTTAQMQKLVMHPPSGHGLLAWWNNQGHGLLPLCLQLQDTLLALCFGRERIPIPQCSYCKILITNLVGEEVWLTSYELWDN